MEGDDEVKKDDFILAMTTSGVPERAAVNILNKYAGITGNWLDFLERSFLSREMKAAFTELIEKRRNQLNG